MMKKLWIWAVLGCLCVVVAGPAPRAAAADDPPAGEATPTAEEETPPPAVTSEPLSVDLSGAEVDVQVVGDSVIVRGVQGDLAVLKALMERLDREIPRRSYRVIRLQNKNAQEMAQLVQGFARSITGRELRPEETIEAQTISNNIILIIGPDARLDEVAKLVQVVDDRLPTLPPIYDLTYQLQHIKAAEAAEKLEELITALRQLQGEDRATQITITPLEAANALFIIAPEPEHEKIRKLISQIDIEPAEGFGDLKLAYFPLLNSKADTLAGVLNDLFATAEGAEAAKETIRRIRMVKSEPGPDGKLIELPPINLERQIKLIADDESQALICATATENIEPLRELIALLDGVPLAVEQSLRVYPLKFADAQTVKEMLDDMFQQGKDLPKPAPGSASSTAVPTNDVGKSLVYNVGLTADTRTNTLVVTGRQEQLLLIEGVILKIDVPSTELKYPLRLITLDHTDATRIGTIIEDLWEKRIETLQDRDAGSSAIAREKVFLAVDIRSNCLIVSATQENYDEIVRITQKLDGAPDRLIDQIRIINCANTSAADLRSKIEELWQRKANLRREGELPEDLPVIVADQRSNALVIASSPEDYEEIKRLIDRLEAQPLAPIAEIRLVTLENNDASQVADMLKGLFEERLEQRLVNGQQENPSDRVAVAAEPATNTMLIASSKENYDEMVRIIQAIDIEPDLEGVVQFFTLHNAQAETVAERINDLFDQGLYHGVVTADNQIAEERQKVALVADPRSNAIIASASKTNLSIVAKLISQMDSDDAPMLNADTRIFQLVFADALKLADILEKLFEGIASNSDGDFAAPTLVADAAGKILIVTGSRDGIKRAADLIASLDRETDRAAAIRVYELEHASAVKIAVKLQEIFERRDEGGETQRTPVFVMADEPTNTLIATASEEDHAVAEHLLALLDVPSTISRQVQVFPLKRAKAEPMAEDLESLFESQAQSGGANAGRADAIAVRPDRRTNSLVVWASRSEMDNIARIIDKLDTTEPATEMMVKVITLKRALAEELAETLLTTLTGGDSAGSGDDAQAVILKFMEELDDGTSATRQLLRQDITIEPDPRTNSLFVMAPAVSMEMLESLIVSIDRIPPTVAEIRLFPLANADAEEIVEKLTELFEEQATEEGPETRLELGDAVATGGTGESGVPGQVLRFTADRRTNMVIAAGSETDLDMVEGLIRQLDSQDVEDRIQMVYEARYVPAGEVVAALRDYFEEENDLLGELDDQSSIMRQAERHVTVVGDEESNSVLIGVSPRYYSRTMEMLYAIDRPPPQVSIQVLIAEVALDDRLEFGMEFALQDLTFSENATIGPNGVVQGHNFDVVGGTSVGAAGSISGFSFAITGEDFNFLLHALQTDGSLEVLSRPTILVENNEEANITIGDNVPFLRSSNVSDSGQINSSVEYEEVGIIVDVTPHINPDGYVNLEIKPEISSLNQGSGVQISEGLTAPTFTNRSADTVVTIKDGETVVIGGLIQTQEDFVESKVPVLGDVPYVGNLFRATQSTRRRTELLIVLTVNVIRDEHDAFVESVKLRDESGFMPDRIKRSPLMHGLRILPSDDDEVYPLDERRSPRRIRREDRPLYGPAPEVYGPARPGRTGSSGKTGLNTYGPPPRGTKSEPIALRTQ